MIQKVQLIDDLILSWLYIRIEDKLRSYLTLNRTLNLNIKIKWQDNSFVFFFDERQQVTFRVSWWLTKREEKLNRKVKDLLIWELHHLEVWIEEIIEINEAVNEAVYETAILKFSWFKDELDNEFKRSILEIYKRFENAELTEEIADTSAITKLITTLKLY